jgi:hypothetical protein
MNWLRTFCGDAEGEILGGDETPTPKLPADPNSSPQTSSTSLDASLDSLMPAEVSRRVYGRFFSQAIFRCQNPHCEYTWEVKQPYCPRCSSPYIQEI